MCDILLSSAGVGRTGAFIVIDAMLERIKHERTVDIYGHVTCLRAQRNYMVQLHESFLQLFFVNRWILIVSVYYVINGFLASNYINWISIYRFKQKTSIFSSMMHCWRLSLLVSQKFLLEICTDTFRSSWLLNLERMSPAWNLNSRLAVVLGD